MINRLLGFLELESIGLPIVDLRKYEDGDILNPDIKWVAKTAVYKGSDISLPRLIGGYTSEIRAFYKTVKGMLGDNAVVFVYPYFEGVKSGVLRVTSIAVSVEAVTGSEYDLAGSSHLKTSITFYEDGREVAENDTCLTASEIEKLRSYARKVKKSKLVLDELKNGGTVQFEWALAGDGFTRGLHFVFYGMYTI